jgi:hypothetical protein
MGGGVRGIVVFSPPKTPPLYSGEGCTLTPSPRKPRATAREEEGGGG